MQSETSAHGIETGDPATIEGVAGQSPALNAAIAHDSNGSSASVPAECHATPERHSTRQPQARARKPASISAAQREAVALTIASTPADDIAARLSVHPATLHRWRAAPWWSVELTAEKGRQARLADAFEGRCRYLLAVQWTRALETAEAAGVTLPIADLRAGSAAFPKSGQERTESVVRDFIAGLPPQLRDAVQAHLDGDTALTELSDDELAARRARRGRT